MSFKIDSNTLNLVQMTDQVREYLPRSLNEDEKKLPISQLRCVIEALVNQPDSIGRTPLIKATLASRVKHEAIDVIPKLILLGANANQKTKYGHTVWDYAAGRHLNNILELLEETISQIKEKENQT